MKQEGYSFDEIQEISKRLEQYKSGNLKTLNQDEFWKEVYTEMNVKIKQYHNA